MIIPDDVVCRTCEKVFCCLECREKHELKTHAIAVNCAKSNLPLFCPICQRKPFILQSVIQAELLTHITQNHLPLNCRKCSRIYSKVQDLMDFSKCTQHIACKLELSKIMSIQDNEASTTPPLKPHASSISTQTSPIYVPQINDSHLTPISMINLRWKSKCKANREFISDSVSSIRNISSIDGSIQRKSIPTGVPIRGKLVRSTSTPLQSDFFNKPKEQVFNVSGGHVSSIYSSVSEPESSPPLVPQIAHTPSTGQIDRINKYQKIRGRGKITASVTPLRQVISKSIQKAIAEHGIEAGSRCALNPKKMFDSIDSSSDVSEKGTDSFPLDLRLSPALRRTQSEIIDRRNDVEFLKILPPIQAYAQKSNEAVHSSIQKQTESVIITTELNKESEILTKGSQLTSSVYQTRRSVQIITSTSTEVNQINIENRDVVIATSTDFNQADMEEDGVAKQKSVPITPRIPISGGTKKLISFETPALREEYAEDIDNSDEQYYTPNSSPVRNSVSKQGDNQSETCSRKFFSMEDNDHSNKIGSIGQSAISIEDIDHSNKVDSIGSDITDAVFDKEELKNDKTQQNKSKLWSLVSSVIRFSSFNNVSESTESSSLIKRCASFAGALVHKPPDNNQQPMKRKRTHTMDSQSLDCSMENTTYDITCSESKRLRIQPRRPIDRMRLNKKLI